MMTPDGIAADDWQEIEHLARLAAEGAMADDHVMYADAVHQLLDRLRTLQSMYGPLPSILATIADYTEDDSEAIRLLENAYFVAEERKDARNMTYIASSIAQRYAEDLSDFVRARAWADVLRRCLMAFPDETEFDALVELEERLGHE